MRRPRAGFLIHASVVAVLFLGPLLLVGEGLFWWAPADADPLAWDEAMLRPGSPEYEMWVQMHPGRSPHCTSVGSSPDGSGSASARCCPVSGGVTLFLHSASSGCGSAGVASAGGTPSAGSGPDGGSGGGGGSGGAGGGGSGGGVGGTGGGGGGGGATPGAGLVATLAALLLGAGLARRRSG